MVTFYLSQNVDAFKITIVFSCRFIDMHAVLFYSNNNFR